MRAVLLVLALVAPFAAAAPYGPVPPSSPLVASGGTRHSAAIGKPVNVDFSGGVSVAQAVAVMQIEILGRPYVIDPAVLKDERVVSFRYDAARGDILAFWRDFLDAMGLELTVRAGVDYVAVKKVAEHKDAETDRIPFIYRTKHRSVSYLVEMLSPLFQQGGFALNRSVRAPVGDKVNLSGPNASSTPIPAHSAASLIDQDSDTLIFQGTSNEISALERLLPEVDVPVGEVVIQAVVYEVTTGKSEGTAFSLAANILGGKFGASVGSSANLANGVTIRTGSIELAISSLAADSRFRVVSSPRVRVKSGQQAQLVVGQDVPTLGAVTVPQQGSLAVQSVDYRSSGVILGLSPIVRQGGVEVRVDQQISDFARTETGVNNSPTLTKRSLTTTVSTQEGELIFLGGLTQDKNSEGHSGLSFLPRFMHEGSRNQARTEILLLLQVTRVRAATPISS